MMMAVINKSTKILSAARVLEADVIPSELESTYLQSEHHMVFHTLPLYFPPSLCQQNEFDEQATRRVDDLLESYMGIRDVELGKITHMNVGSLK